MKARAAAALLAVSALVLPGCMSRRIEITSEPPGALVWVNDVEIGRTPCETDFTYYGWYDVRLRLEGYEPLVTQAEASQPIYEMPPVDLFATVSPVPIETEIAWHFVMEPAKERSQTPEELKAGLFERAAELRRQIDPSLPE